MAGLFSGSYLKVLKNRDFLILSLVIFLGQVASAILILSLIVSVFTKTSSNFGVSGVVLSFTIPALFLIAFAGVAADIFDRRKIILISNFFISIVVLAILLTERLVYASIPLSFLYFAGNSFFIPASSAATAQLVKKNHLLIANSVFVFILSAGLIAGFLVGAVVNYFFGHRYMLWICEILLIAAAILPAFLPNLKPVGKTQRSFENIRAGFTYVFSEKLVWLYFLLFSGIQGVIFFGVTIAPGFYDEIIGININRSPIFIFPFIGIGVVLGLFSVQRFKLSEIDFVKIGLFILGLALLLLALIIKIVALSYDALVLTNVFFLMALGFGAIIVIVAARTGLQKKVAHFHQGTVFGASILLASLFATFMSPFAAVFEVLVGYLGILFLGGLGIILASIAVSIAQSRWK